MKEVFMQCLIGMDVFNICREVNRGLMPEKAIKFEFENPLKSPNDELGEPKINTMFFSVNLPVAKILAVRMTQIVLDLQAEEEKLIAAGFLKPYSGDQDEVSETSP